MKTLEQLWKESGEKPGLKIKHEGWLTPITILGQAKDKDLIGYDERDYTVRLGASAECELYVEPPPPQPKLVLWRLKDGAYCPDGAIVAFPADVVCNDRYERVSLSDIEGWEK